MISIDKIDIDKGKHILEASKSLTNINDFDKMVTNTSLNHQINEALKILKEISFNRTNNFQIILSKLGIVQVK